MLANSRDTSTITPFTSSPVERFIHHNGQIRSLRRHTLIYSAGDPSAQFYLITSGEVKLSRHTPEGRELTLDHLDAGSIFGEIEILLGRNRECQAVARTELRMVAVDREPLLEMMERDPKFGLWLAQRMSNRQTRMEDRLESLLFKSANGKVAQLLVNLAREYGQETPEGIVINYPITHQEIGNLIATTRETVSYAFMEFRRMGLISSRQRKTIVHDLNGLSGEARR